MSRDDRPERHGGPQATRNHPQRSPTCGVLAKEPFGANVADSPESPVEPQMARHPASVASLCPRSRAAYRILILETIGRFELRRLPRKPDHRGIPTLRAQLARSKGEDRQDAPER